MPTSVRAHTGRRVQADSLCFSDALQETLSSRVAGRIVKLTLAPGVYQVASAVGAVASDTVMAANATTNGTAANGSATQEASCPGLPPHGFELGGSASEVIIEGASDEETILDAVSGAVAIFTIGPSSPPFRLRRLTIRGGSNAPAIVMTGGFLEATGCAFTNSSAGAVALSNARMDVRRSAFLSNGGPLLDQGGAVLASLAAEITITDSLFADNSARWGGAIFLDATPTPSAAAAIAVRVERSVFRHNVAFHGGGALGVLHGLRLDVAGPVVGGRVTATVEQSTMQSNRAGSDGGGAISAQASFGGPFWRAAPAIAITISFSNLTHNRATARGGAIVASRASVTLQNQTSLIENCCASEMDGLCDGESPCGLGAFDDSTVLYSLPAPPGTWIQASGSAVQGVLSSVADKAVAFQPHSFPYPCPAGYLGWDGVSTDFLRVQSQGSCAGPSEVGGKARNPRPPPIDVAHPLAPAAEPRPPPIDSKSTPTAHRCSAPARTRC